MATAELGQFSQRLNAVIEQGSKFNPVLTLTDSTSTLINLTGYTARMQIRETVDAATTIASLTTENGGITLGGAAGTVTLYISGSDTAAFDFEVAVYDLELVDGSGDVQRWVYGDVSLSKEVTR